jgi:hypothetical protein
MYISSKNSADSDTLLYFRLFSFLLLQHILIAINHFEFMLGIYVLPFTHFNSATIKKQ